MQLSRTMPKVFLYASETLWRGSSLPGSGRNACQGLNGEQRKQDSESRKRDTPSLREACPQTETLTNRCKIAGGVPAAPRCPSESPRNYVVLG
jgi:hypothetical protein